MITRIYPEEFLPTLMKHISDEYGFVIFVNGLFNLNIIGCRNPLGTPNKFDDKLHVIYKCNHSETDTIVWKEIIYDCTMNPGNYWLEHGTRRDGCAIIAHPQQCRGAYKLDLHRGQYLALCHRLKPVQVWRDKNKDTTADIGGTTGQLFTVNSGINIHRASANFTSQNVNRYSAGCTVLNSKPDFDHFINLCKSQTHHGQGSSYTYTVIQGSFI